MDLPILTPRSERACLLSGVEPRELVPLAIAAFAEPGQPHALQELKWKKYEDSRQEAFKLVQQERDKIIEAESKSDVAAESDSGCISTTLLSYDPDNTQATPGLHEQRMIEKIQRRQQAEIEGMLIQEIRSLKVMEEKAQRARASQARGSAPPYMPIEPGRAHVCRCGCPLCHGDHLLVAASRGAAGEGP